MDMIGMLHKSDKNQFQSYLGNFLLQYFDSDIFTHTGGGGWYCSWQMKHGNKNEAIEMKI